MFTKNELARMKTLHEVIKTCTEENYKQNKIQELEELKSRLLPAIENLPHMQRLVIYYQYVLGYNISDTATAIYKSYIDFSHTPLDYYKQLVMANTSIAKSKIIKS